MSCVGIEDYVSHPTTLYQIYYQTVKIRKDWNYYILEVISDLAQKRHYAGKRGHSTALTARKIAKDYDREVRAGLFESDLVN